MSRLFFFFFESGINLVLRKKNNFDMAGHGCLFLIFLTNSMLYNVFANLSKEFLTVKCYCKNVFFFSQ